MRESELEFYFRRRVKELGGLAVKFTSPGMAGVPDRLVLISGRAIFVELKAEGKKLRPIQLYRKQQLEALGQTVHCLDSRDAVDKFIQKVNDAIRTT